MPDFPFQTRNLGIQFIYFLFQLLHNLPVFRSMSFQSLYFYELVLYFFLFHLGSGQFLVVTWLGDFAGFTFVPFPNWVIINLGGLDCEFGLHCAVLHNVNIYILNIRLCVKIFDLGQWSAWSRFALTTRCADRTHASLIALYLVLQPIHLPHLLGPEFIYLPFKDLADLHYKYIFSYNFFSRSWLALDHKVDDYFLPFSYNNDYSKI